MLTESEISCIVNALASRKGYGTMSFEELIFYVAFDTDLCNTVIHALDVDAMNAIHSLLN